MTITQISKAVSFINITAPHGYKALIAKEFRAQAEKNKSQFDELGVKTEDLAKWIKFQTEFFSYHKGMKPKVRHLETHAYAPELNRLVLKDGTELRTPYKKTVKDAITHLFFNSIK